MRYKIVADYIEDLLCEFKNTDQYIQDNSSGLVTIKLDNHLRYVEKVHNVIAVVLNDSDLFNQIYNYMYDPDKPLYTWRELSKVLNITYGELTKIRKKCIYKISNELGIYITDNIFHY